MLKKSARQASSRSKNLEVPALSAAILALGEKLVVELKLVESTDTLARWMAHYVAELLVRAKHAPPPKRDQAEALCAGAILDLWEHVRAFPVESKAFESIDRVFETIESLRPDSKPYYRNDLWRTLNERAYNEGSEVEKFLTIALGIDAAARNLIHHVLAHALSAAGRDSAEWLEIAQHLEEEDPLTELRISMVRSGRHETLLKKHRIEELERRIAQLEYFNAAAQGLKEDLIESLADAKAVVEKHGK